MGSRAPGRTSWGMRHVVVAGVMVAGIVGVSVPGSAVAQGAAPCPLLCSPSLILFPAFNRSPIAGAPRVQSLHDGSIHRLSATSNFEIALVGTVQTAVPRLGLLGSVEWTPFATEQGNPFTRYSASEIGSTYDRANSPSVTLVVTGALIRPADTRGWFGLSVYVGDLYGPAQRPDDRTSYTHKFDLEFVTNTYPFARLPHATWAHGMSVTLLLDHVATGLPHKGDEVPRGERVYLDSARPLTFVAGLSLPLTSSAQ